MNHIEIRASIPQQEWGLYLLPRSEQVAVFKLVTRQKSEIPQDKSLKYHKTKSLKYHLLSKLNIENIDECNSGASKMAAKSAIEECLTYSEQI